MTLGQEEFDYAATHFVAREAVEDVQAVLMAARRFGVPLSDDVVQACHYVLKHSGPFFGYATPTPLRDRTPQSSVVCGRPAAPSHRRRAVLQSLQRPPRRRLPPSPRIPGGLSPVSRTLVRSL
eukprot:EG_transcript_41747